MKAAFLRLVEGLRPHQSERPPGRNGMSETGGIAHLLTAEQVGPILGVRAKRVYELGIPSVKISERSVRWRPEAVRTWIKEREER